MATPLLAGPFQSEWDATVPYVAGNVVFDRGGWWLRTALNPGTTNSRPISGTTDWTLVAGTPYVDVTLDPVALTSSLFQNNSDTTSGIVVIPAPGVGLRAM